MSQPLWLVDRSRIIDGRGFCARARYLSYHSGPNGYGISLKGQKLPLMTGALLHDAIADVLGWCRDHDGLILAALEQVRPEETILVTPRAVVREAVQGAQAAYAKAIEARGFAYLDQSEDVQQVTREQQALVEGLLWCWTLEVLPEMLRRGRIVEVEVEGTYVYDCTCGLGDGVLAKEDHEARDCQGTGLMCRPDFILETRQTKELEYHEFKTTSTDSPMFRDKWEVQAQLVAATLDAERRLGQPVQSVYIHGLLKGRREGDYNSETGQRDGLIRQNSPCCYGWRRGAIPPMQAEDWKASYDYWDEAEQKTKRLGRAYKKATVWELPGVPEGMSSVEVWVLEHMSPAVRRKQLILIGPLSRQQQQIEGFLQESGAEERRWRDGLWHLHDVTDGKDWTEAWATPEFQAALNAEFPRSYECRRYGMRNRCGFEDVCFGREGWADPLGTGRYVERRPHHAEELQQAIDRGLLLPEVGVAEEGGEE